MSYVDSANCGYDDDAKVFCPGLQKSKNRCWIVKYKKLVGIYLY